VTEEKQADLPKQQTQDHGSRCPTCAAFTRLAHSVLDSRNGRTVHLYQCQYGGNAFGIAGSEIRELGA
jgi:hypothetical protein